MLFRQLAVCLLVFLVCLSPLMQARFDLTFEQYVQKFNKAYTEPEYSERRQIYIRNVDRLSSSACQACGINNFTDWKESEKQQLLTFRQSEAKSRIAAHPQNKSIESRLLTTTVPDAFDWRDEKDMTPIKHQELCGSCWAFSTVAFYEQESIINLNQNATLDLSEQFILECDKVSQRCEGGNIFSSMDLVIEKKGIPKEQLHPYMPNSFNDSICSETDLFQVQDKYRMSYYDIDDQEQIKETILKQPVNIGICAVDFTDYAPTEDNRMLKCNPLNRNLDHAVLLIGYTDTQWIIRNQWGESWGVNGYAYISRDSAHDCCIGVEMHTSGAVTETCSVADCEVCVEENTCYECTAGKYVYHDYETQVQSCVDCQFDHCAKCFDYYGMCEYCEYGYALMGETFECEPATVEHCAYQFGTNCYECHSGYAVQYTYSGSTCVPDCELENCIDCRLSECEACDLGYFLEINIVLAQNSSLTQTRQCTPYACDQPNCSGCDADGVCIRCDEYFTLNEETKVCENLCDIDKCLDCQPGYWRCYLCEDELTFDYMNEVCETFQIENCNLNFHGDCIECRPGYQSNDDATKCEQICLTENCYTCDKTDISICQECDFGYLLTTQASGQITCELQPCDLTNCTFCDEQNTTCLKCVTDYHIWNETSNACEVNCTLDNCVLCLEDDEECAECAEGYTLEQTEGVCMDNNDSQTYVEHCILLGWWYGQLECWECKQNYYVDLVTWKDCHIDCDDSQCKDCDPDNLAVCLECRDGYELVISGSFGQRKCTFIEPIMEDCILVSQNQTYCFRCEWTHVYDAESQTCQPNTDGCREECKYCDPDQNASSDPCICQQGLVWDYFNDVCILNTIDENCLEIYDVGSFAYCSLCAQGYYSDISTYTCAKNCLVENCKNCYYADNDYCSTCQYGYTPKNGTCIECPSYCSTCTKEMICQTCEIGFKLNTSFLCEEITCSGGKEFIDFSCECPMGLFWDTNSQNCQPCQGQHCSHCDESGDCTYCMEGYFLDNQTDPLNPFCSECMDDCLWCGSDMDCYECEFGMFFDAQEKECIFYGEEFHTWNWIDSTTAIICPAGCLNCDQNLTCLNCTSGYTLNDGFCLQCEDNCGTCFTSNPSACLSCYFGYSLVDTTCVVCSDDECTECINSPNQCTKCSKGMFLVNRTCSECPENCKTCSNDTCSECKLGFTLIDSACKPCIENCGSCNSSAIEQCLGCVEGFYMVEGVCVSCPSNCKNCTSETNCTSCYSGYELRMGGCHEPCNDGCVSCAQDPSNCTKCFAGYSLTSQNDCEVDVSCSLNDSCVACPIGYALSAKKCVQCQTTDSNCRECKSSSLTVCTKCASGFYLENNMCKACSEQCKTCIQANKCLTCSTGYFLQSVDGQSTGKCKGCISECKTCSELSNKCESCHQNFILTGTGRCRRKERIELEIVLEMALSEFTASSSLLSQSMLELISEALTSLSHYLVFNSVASGSTVIDASISIPEGQDPKQAFEKVQSSLTNGSTLGGVNVISVNSISLEGVEITDDVDGTQTTSSDGSDNNTTIIVVAIVIPVVVLMIVGLLCYWKKVKSNRVEELDQQSIEDLERRQQAQSFSPNFDSKVHLGDETPDIEITEKKLESIKKHVNRPRGIAKKNKLQPLEQESPSKKDLDQGNSLAHTFVSTNYDAFNQTQGQSVHKSLNSHQENDPYSNDLANSTDAMAAVKQRNSGSKEQKNQSDEMKNSTASHTASNNKEQVRRYAEQKVDSKGHILNCSQNLDEKKLKEEVEIIQFDDGLNDPQEGDVSRRPLHEEPEKAEGSKEYVLEIDEDF